MSKEYITIRIENKVKDELDKIKHNESIEQKSNLSISDTLNLIIDNYYKYKDLEY